MADDYEEVATDRRAGRPGARRVPPAFMELHRGKRFQNLRFGVFGEGETRNGGAPRGLGQMSGTVVRVTHFMFPEAAETVAGHLGCTPLFATQEYSRWKATGESLLASTLADHAARGALGYAALVVKGQIEYTPTRVDGAAPEAPLAGGDYVLHTGPGMRLTDVHKVYVRLDEEGAQVLLPPGGCVLRT